MAKFKKTMRRKTYKKKKPVSLAKKLLKLTDSKSFNYQHAGVTLTHGFYYSTCPTQHIVQGTTNVTRIGDSCYLQSFKVQGVVNAPAASGTFRYRMIVAWSTVQVANITFTNGILGGSNLFHSGTDAVTTNGIINSKAITVLSDSIIDINSNFTSGTDLRSFALTVPINQNFQYVADGSTFGKRKNLFFLVLPYATNGASGLTPAGAVSFSYQLKFKDP